jgi:co-chaperonin GroES (HSP10)
MRILMKYRTNQMKKLKELLAIGPKVVIKIDKLDEKSENGIVLIKDYVDRQQNAISEGVLVHVGSTAFDYLDEKNSPTIGDHVYFVKYAGIGKNIDDEEFRIMNDEDIYAIGVMIDEQ